MNSPQKPQVRVEPKSPTGQITSPLLATLRQFPMPPPFTSPDGRLRVPASGDDKKHRKSQSAP
ncbi:hypothetical protein ARMGADRAFT_1016428 [Armillaria gallica]|uniref:Uncharacterized protein n=1 Tax=Armillaria gallica TaxID=47427 RepID=A0A2H3CXU3_ARMGA|nr:hypothetical protein ARMGADRAFT_1016428 [Armillaria gallica]